MTPTLPTADRRETVTINGQEFKVASGWRPRNDAAAPAIASAPKKRNKYGARSVEIDGIRFDSKREGDRWLKLKINVALGEIHDLERQVTYQLAPSVKIEGEKRARPALRFTADFRYVETKTGKTVVEDAKGFRGDTAFKIRQHLMATVHGIHVRLS